MKNTLSALSAALLSLPLFAQAPENSEDIMLQGFFWDSQKSTSWLQLTDCADEIGDNFTAIWLPPSAAASFNPVVGGSDVGYHPMTWNNQNSCWGTAANLKSLISKLHDKNVKVIADIVINHRAGYTDWCNFSADDFGEYGSFQLTGEHICSTDETNTGHVAGEAYGSADTGDNWEGARDLDHSSTYVQDDVKAYLKWLRGEIGYDGWRYDLVKGFSGSFVGIYNEASLPYISVGEYWEAGYDAVWNWINATGKKSMAFDFPAKYEIFNKGLAQGNFSNMTWSEDYVTPRPAGLIHHRQSNRYAVTFVDNHDTYRDDNRFSGDWEQAYAVLMASPGIPCVFWPHWQACKDVISRQIAVRHAAGIHSQSDVRVTVTSGYYESLSVGNSGSLICRVGHMAPSEAPEGYYLALTDEGNDWYYFLSNNVSLPTSLPNKADEASVYVSGDMLHVKSSAPVNVVVSAVDGRVIYRSAEATDVSLPLPHGLNIVGVNGKSYKFAIK